MSSTPSAGQYNALLRLAEQTARLGAAEMLPVLDRLPATRVACAARAMARGWTGSFPDLLLTAVDVVDADLHAVLVLQLDLYRADEDAAEELVFAGAKARAARRPETLTISDAHLALERLRESRSACPGCGKAVGPWALSSSLGHPVSWFIERWCRNCADIEPRVARQTAAVDFGGLWRSRVLSQPRPQS